MAHAIKRYSFQATDESQQKVTLHGFKCTCGKKSEGYSSKSMRDRGAEAHITPPK